MKNIDIDEWLLANNIDPTTSIEIKNGEAVFVHDLLEKHLKEQIGVLQRYADKQYNLGFSEGQEVERINQEALSNKPKCGGCKIKDRDMLIQFFKFFRDNGEANIGMTIEQFVDGFLNPSKP